MKNFSCNQRGCEFEAEEIPDNCPVCNNKSGFVHLNPEPIIVPDTIIESEKIENVSESVTTNTDTDNITSG